MALIRATMPGVFYRGPGPEAEPYVEEGSRIAAGQTIALIEVMKTFNEVKADSGGVVSTFLLHTGDEVTMGQGIAEVDGA
jgi:acetyl-CoA carboxylase biotin carboxyl carrier protein